MVEDNFKASRTASISILGAQGTVAKPAATLYKAMDSFVKCLPTLVLDSLLWNCSGSPIGYMQKSQSK